MEDHQQPDNRDQPTATALKQRLTATLQRPFASLPSRIVMSVVLATLATTLIVTWISTRSIGTFLGRETEPGHFQEVCLQCGQCLLGRYAAICPITQCAKGLLSGPCGGSKDGRCEQQSVRDCAWVLIYERLKKTGHLDKLMAPAPPRDYSKTKRPRAYETGESGRGSAEG